MIDVPPIPADDGRPLLVVWGNCQAESLRLLIDTGDLRSAQLPAVHEIQAEHVAAVHRWVGSADVLVAQPVADDYHDLPIGTSQLVDLLRPSSRSVVVPVVRYAGIQPHHVVIHPPHLPDPLPPLVPYHDLTVATAASWRAAGHRAPPHAAPELTPDAVQAIGRLSLDRLRERETRADVAVSDLFDHPGFAAMRTINHPGNVILEPLARRVREALGLPVRPATVTRDLLSSIHAPRLAAVAAAYDPGADLEPDWWLEGRRLPTSEVAAAHAAFYAARPDVLDEVLRRSRPERDLLALRTPEECA